jgi:hypothetical protein
MNDICGRMCSVPFARWDRDSQSWRTSAATSLWDLTLSSLTLPTWGGLHDGELCEHPTPAPATSVPAYSSLPTPTADNSRGLPSSSTDYQSLANVATMLPTPKARDYKDHQIEPATHRPDATDNLNRALAHLLPTPTAQAAKDGETPDLTAASFGSNLWDLPHLLPTPAVNDMGRGKTVEAWDTWTDNMKAAHGNGNGHGKSLEIEVLRIGDHTLPPSPGGSTSPGGPHPNQHNQDETENHDCQPGLWNG